MGGAVIWMVAISLLRVEAKEVQIVSLDTSRAWVLVGDVTVTTEKVRIYAPRGIYYEGREMGYLSDTVVFSSDSTLIVSDTMYYWQSERFLFTNYATVLQPKRFLGAEQIDVVGDYAYLSGPIYVNLLSSNTTFWGDTGVFDIGNKRGKIWRDARLEIRKSDSIKVEADSFYFFEDTLWAVGNVKLKTSKFSVVGDTFYFRPGEKSFAAIWGDTEIKAKNETISTKSISFFTKDGKVEALYASGDVDVLSNSKEGSTELRSSYSEFHFGPAGKLEGISAYSNVKGVYRKGEGDEDVGPKS